MVERAHRGTHRTVTAVVLVVCALALLADAVVSLLPRAGDSVSHKVLTTSDLIAAYARIRPGQTHASQLSRYGFDATSAGAQVLSYLGVMERFMPRDSTHFDRLDPAIKDCVAVPDHCTALVFRSSRPKTAIAQGLFPAYAVGAPSPTPQVTLLIRNGRVAFKMISGVNASRDVPTRQARAVVVPFRMSY